MTKKMEQTGKALVREPLAQVFKQARAVLTARTVQDLQAKLGKPLKGIDKLTQVPQQDRQAAEQTLMTGVKKSMKTFYVKSLEQQVKKIIEAGVDESHPMVQDYKNIIGKIKAL
jgi:hypothetical protein